MFKIESNIDQWKKDFKLNLTELVDADKVLRQAAFDAVVLVSDRVQHRGENAEGEKMKTSSIKKYGAYSYYYGKKKRDEEEGLQTEHIDLTFSGDMMGDFLPAPEGKNSYVVGFRGQLSSDKADWNERKFGPIFKLTEKETKIIVDSVKEQINAIISNRHK